MRLPAYLFLALFITCCASREDYRPDSHLTAEAKDKTISTIIRYVAERPKKANDSTKFDSSFDEHYKEQAAAHQLTHYFFSPDGEHFFLIQRRAPSLYEKYVATGGRMRFDANDSLVEYEEVFRTWKMPKDTLARRGAILFEKMVKGESLTPFLTANSGGVEYIEFPDPYVYYDKQARTWKSTQIGSVEESVLQGNSE